MILRTGESSDSGGT